MAVLGLNLEQKLQLKPQLYQSMGILALDAIGLQEAAERMLEENPALEQKEPAMKEDAERWNSGSSFVAPADIIEATASASPSLQSRLLEQLSLEDLDEEELVIGQRIIQNLDNDGFHRERPEELCQNLKQKAALVKMLRIIRGFEPAGCACRDSIESLAVQAELEPFAPEATYSNMSKAIAWLEKGEEGQAAEALGLDREEGEAVSLYIKSLSPYPGRSYSGRPAAYVRADLILEKKEGRLILRHTEDGWPALDIDPFFTELASSGEDSRARRYAKEKIREARGFLQAVAFRRQTLAKIGIFLAEAQRDFFLRGAQHLKPLTMKQAAHALGLHEATVSRAVAGKRIQTESGLIEMKTLFARALGGSRGAVSSETVKNEIRAILAATEGKKISDQKIAVLLQQKGISIARRTVAKYRKSLASYK